MEPARAVKERIMGAHLANSTLVNYASCWKSFTQWCRAAGRDSLPATTKTCIDHVAWCIANGFRLETAILRMKAVRHYHALAGMASPYDDSVREFFRCARRDLCERPQGKAALTLRQLTAISEAFSGSQAVADVRDRALVLLCFAAGWRCSELVSLDRNDVRWEPQGVVLYLAKSKTDQEGRGRSVGVPRGEKDLTCPLRALQEWIDVRGEWPGPLFTRLNNLAQPSKYRLDPDGVRRAVKRGLKAIGEDATDFGAHSLRAGMITAAVENGATETAIMQRTGHSSYEMIRRYTRPASVFRVDPLKGVL